MRIHFDELFADAEKEPMPVRPLPWAFGFVLFAVLALLLGGAAVLVLAALGFMPNGWLCALAIVTLEILLFYVAFGSGGKNLHKRMPPRQ